MAHPLLHPPDASLGDHPRPERVPQVVEAQRTELGPDECGLVAPPQRRAVEMPAGYTGKDRIVFADEMLPRAQPSQRLGHVGGQRDRPDLPDLGVVTSPSP